MPPSPPQRRDATRPLRESDRTAWAEYVRHVAPLPGRHRPEIVTAAPAVRPRPALPLAKPATGPARLVPLVLGAQPAGVDNATWSRFRTGRLPVSRTLDLHGRTAEHAFHALASFLHRAQADRVRCVEVITGRGSGEMGGVLRRELPLWLNLPELRGLVLAAAHPHAANVGAVRLLLRRPR
jgi:DNA-nicking Smr family endonuclease